MLSVHPVANRHYSSVPETDVQCLANQSELVLGANLTNQGIYTQPEIEEMISPFCVMIKNRASVSQKQNRLLIERQDRSQKPKSN